jgi:hypothetical protein
MILEFDKNIHTKNIFDNIKILVKDLKPKIYVRYEESF